MLKSSLSINEVELSVVIYKHNINNNISGGHAKKKGLILTIPYIAGLNESIQRECRDFDFKTALKPGKIIQISTETFNIYAAMEKHGGVGS